MQKLIYAIIALVIFNNVQAQTPPSLTITQFATGFSIPVGIENCGDSRLFIVQQRGLIRILNANGTINSSAFLDISSLVSSTGNERGLLGLTFHPNYATNGYFYVNYTRSSDGATRVSRFSVNPANPNDALENSELNILTIAQPYSNHNGGQIRFGPDGYLYIGMGDGGSADDPQGYGQSTTTLLGKMLRIDVDNGTPYSIPASNPFNGSLSVENEIWAIGMRNPWRFNFDRCTGDLWIGDVGQDFYEEVDFQPASSTGGENYGWRCREGLHACPTCNTSGCATTGFTDPIYEYQHTNPNGCSISGGYVYRGGIYGAMYGWYLFTDYCSGRIWGSYPNGSGGFTTSVLTTNTTITNNLSTFGEDYRGELYLAGQSNGRIYKITVSTCLPSAAICGGDIEICQGETADLTAIFGEGNTYQWQLNGSDIIGATSSTYSTTEPGTYTVVVTNGSLCSGESNAVVVSLCTSVNETAAGKLNLYPNPAENTLNIEFYLSGKTDVVITIYNTTGQLVKAENNLFESGLNKLQTDIAALTNGVYVAEIKSEYGKTQKRFVVSR